MEESGLLIEVGLLKVGDTFILGDYINIVVYNSPYDDFIECRWAKNLTYNFPSRRVKNIFKLDRDAPVLPY